MTNLEELKEAESNLRTLLEPIDRIGFESASQIYLAQLALEKWAMKMQLCHTYGGNCGICMIAAPYPYCCRAECGTKDYCEGCNYNDEESYET